MAADVIDGTTPLVFSCAYFRNPIYARELKGFQVTLLDSELIRKIIEKSYSLTLDATDYLPITFDDRYLTILPTNPVINTISEWSLTLTPPIPLDTGCFIKLYLPNDTCCQQ